MRSTYAYLSSGSSSALNSSTPASRAMRSAVRSESPVSMTTCLTPNACKSAMASRTPGLSGSSIPSTPTTVPSTARYSGDRPCIWDSICSLMSDSSCATCCPCPRSTAAWRSRCSSPRSRAAFTTARATGCGKCSSKQAERRRISSSLQPSVVSTQARRGCASVSVPVLSNTMVSALANDSKYLAPLTITPILAASLMAVMTATEPVSLSAHE